MFYEQNVYWEKDLIQIGLDEKRSDKKRLQCK